MPIYEYQCVDCGKKFETMQKITEEPLSSCPYCSGTVKKLVSNCSFQLKGSGWYLTDYARKSDTDKATQKGNKVKKKEEKKEKKTEVSDTSAKPKETAKKDKAINE